jgi:hypothetical protein
MFDKGENIRHFCILFVQTKKELELKKLTSAMALSISPLESM